MSPPIEAREAIGFPGGVATIGDNRQGAYVPDLLPHFFVVVGDAPPEKWSDLNYVL